MRLATIAVVGVLTVACGTGTLTGGDGGAGLPDARELEDGGEALDASASPDAGDAAGFGDAGTPDAAAPGDAGNWDAGPADAGEAPDSGAPPPSGCGDWQVRHPEWLWCDDFEDGRTLDDKYQNVSTRGLSVSDAQAFDGTHALRQHYDLGQVDAGWIAWHLGDAPASNGTPGQDVLHMRWFHLFPEGFQGMPPKMARIRRLERDWSKGVAVHHWVVEEMTGWPVVADVYAPDSTQANSAGWLAKATSSFRYTDQGNLGRWVCHEMQVVMNTPGRSDGAYRFWADGVLVVERTGVDLRGSKTGGMNQLMLDTYWNAGSPQAQDRWYDALVISTEYIGCEDLP